MPSGVIILFLYLISPVHYNYSEVNIYFNLCKEENDAKSQLIKMTMLLTIIQFLLGIIY